MADLPIDTGGSVLDEGRHGYAAAIDTSGDFMHLPPEERAAAKKRRRAQRERWERAQAIRGTWGPEQFEEEEARLRAEIDAWVEGQRHAA